jgi:O-antigen/teichoic acid export membrane protein
VSSLIVPLGLDNGVIHCATPYATSDPARLARVLRESFTLTLVFGALVTATTVLLAPEVARRVFGKADLVPVIRLFAIGFSLTAGLKVVAASTTVSQSIKFRVYSELLAQPASNLVLFFLFYAIGWRLLGATAATVISFGVGLAFAIWYQQKLFPHVHFHGPVLSKKIASELLRFSTAAWLGAVFLNLIPWLDRLFLGAYAAPATVGVYQAAAQACMLFGVIAGAFNVVVAPRISFLHQSSQMHRLEQVYKVVTKWIVYANTPVFLLFFFAPRQLLDALYGTKYSVSAAPLVILTFAQLVGALAGPIGILLIFTARQKIFSVVAGGGLVLSAALNYALIPRFGSLGAASATACGNIAILFALLLIAHSAMGFWPYDKRWLKGLLAAAAAAALLWLVRPMDIQPSWIALVATAGLSSVVFAGGLLLLRLDREDREMIRTLKLFLGRLTA